MLKRDFLDLCVDYNDSILNVLKKMDELKRKLLIVTNDNKYHSLISIGDLQRAIIKNENLNSPIRTILRKSVSVAKKGDNIDDIKKLMLNFRIEFMPIISIKNEIYDVLFWEDLFTEGVNSKSNNQLNLPVVIMAGGKGTRLIPLTNILPKPLIPIGEKTIIEDIMDRFVDSGCNKFFISINYKADLIKYYFNSLSNPDYSITYFQEKKPLGTAGSLNMLKNKIDSTFFVTNCDIIIEQDYADVLNYHRTNKNEITVVAAIKNIKIPYGTIETKENGLIETLSEKPEYTFKINTGFYILEPHLIDEIPEDTFYHITFLIEKLYNEGRKVGVFPISEGSWIDIGNWEEYFSSFKNK